MVNIAARLILLLFITGIAVILGCSGAGSTVSQTAVTPSVQTTDQQNAPGPAQTGSQVGVQANTQVTIPQNAASATVPVKTSNTPPPVLSNRIDVVYFHAKVRCTTCLCFEKQVTNLINKYFQDVINSGKLTYRVLNVQDPMTTAVARKYGAVGSQLFINNVINDFDNIEDIQDIWSWDCVNNPSGFDMKIKSVIEQYLKGKP